MVLVNCDRPQGPKMDYRDRWEDFHLLIDDNRYAGNPNRSVPLSGED